MELVSGSSPVHAILVGEAMLELSAGGGGLWHLAYGGDTLNTAVHLARLGCRASFASAIGSDALSADLPARWQAEGLDCSLVLTDPARSTGLYSISLDAAGERSFSYWRSDSAARQMFALPESAGLAEAIGKADLLAFSLITLAILPAAGRERLLAAAQLVRENGGTVAFDGNYRPRLWVNSEEAQRWRDRAIACADIGLPTLEDEQALAGARGAEDVAAHWSGLGCSETIVKLGAAGVRLPSGELVAPDQVLVPVDTSGAGDAFNAGYLAARLAGLGPEQAAKAGQELAGWTIMQRGAIPASDATAPYARLKALFLSLGGGVQS